ncbi:MAG: DUF5679 domain-containing protein [Terriglobales bacterium]
MSDVQPSTKTAFCVKCRHKVPLSNPTVKINSRGVKMLQDKCPECASVVNTFVKKDVSAPVPIPEAVPVADS